MTTIPTSTLARTSTAKPAAAARRDFARPALRAAWVAVALALSGCGGGSDTAATPTATVQWRSTSFSPTKATASVAGTAPTVLTWRYAMAGSEPVDATVAGVSMRLQYQPIDVRIDPATLERTSTVTADVQAVKSGLTLSGTVTTRVEEQLQQPTQGSRFTSQVLDTTATLGAAGAASTLVTMRIAAQPLEPGCAWLPDRDDLSTLAVGAVLTTTCGGPVTSSLTVGGGTPDVRSGTVTLDERWTVLEQLPTMTVRGVVYRDVVKLRRETSAPGLDGAMLPRAMTYWLARGVGMVRGEGVFPQATGGAVAVELAGTNLTVPN